MIFIRVNIVSHMGRCGPVPPTHAGGRNDKRYRRAPVAGKIGVTAASALIGRVIYLSI